VPPLPSPSNASSVPPPPPVLPRSGPPPPPPQPSPTTSALLTPAVRGLNANSSANFHPSQRFGAAEGQVTPGGHAPNGTSTAAPGGVVVDASKAVEQESDSKLQASMSLESLLQEIDHTVREWSVAMRAALAMGNVVEHHRGMERLSSLLECRRRLMDASDDNNRASVRSEIIELIEGSRKMAEGYMVPRNAAGAVADASNTGVVELLTLHRSMYSALKEESSSVWIAKGKARRAKSFKKQAEELARAGKEAALAQGGAGGAGVPGGAGQGVPGAAAASAGGAASQSPQPATPVASSTPSHSSQPSSGGGLNNGAPGAPGGGASATLAADGLGPLSSGLVTRPMITGKKYPTGPLQLYLNVKMCIFSVGEATDLFFSLYSGVEARFVTEEYALALSDQGLPINLALLHKMRTVFANLSASDFEKDLWLVCRIFRKGKLVFDGSKVKPGQRLHRRPFGCAACSMTESSLDSMIGREWEPPNAAMTIYTCADESKFSRIHELIIARDHRSLEPAPRAKGIALGLVLYAGELDAVRKAQVETMADESLCPVSAKLRFPPRISPADFRNDLYVHLLAGSFSQDGKKSAKNVECALRVVLDDGSTVENCISHGVADPSPQSEYHSTVYYHLNTPFYMETVRLNVPPAIMERAHLFISFWHVSTSKKISCFSFSYLPLTTEAGAVILDQEYKLPAFKAFPKIESSGPGMVVAPFYLEGENAKPKLEPRKEFLTVRTQSLSTVHTQSLVLHSVFKHSHRDVTQIRGLMDRFISGTSRDNLPELIRFLRETLDTLLAMLVTPRYLNELESIFAALLHALALATDKKNILPGGVACWDIVEEYIDELFCKSAKHAQIFAQLHPVLIRLTTHMLQEAVAVALKGAIGAPASTPTAGAGGLGATDNSLLKLCKTLHYVLKLIIRSRGIEVRLAQESGGMAGGDTQVLAFKHTMTNLLGEVQKLVGADSRDELGLAQATLAGGAGAGAPSMAAMNTSPTAFILPAQSCLVRSFPESIHELLEIFSAKELGVISRGILQALPRQSVQSGNKLHMLRNILLSRLGDHADSRAILFPEAISHLQVHLMAVDQGGLGEPYVCIAILNHMLSVVSRIELERKAALEAGQTPPPQGSDATMLDIFVPLLQPIVHVALAIQHNTLANAAGSAAAGSSATGGAGGAGNGASATTASSSVALSTSDKAAPSSFVSLKAPSDAILALIQIDVVVDSITVLWTLLSLLSDQQVEAFINGLAHTPPPPPVPPMPGSAPSAQPVVQVISPRSELHHFLGELLAVCSNSLTAKCYPSMWIVMNMLECRTITRVITLLGKPIRQTCIEVPHAGPPSAALMDPNAPARPQHPLLRGYFSLILSMLMYDQLQLEAFPPRKRQFVSSRWGDLRGELVHHFQTVWSALGKDKMAYIDGFLVTKLFDLARMASGHGVGTESPAPASTDAAEDEGEGHASREFALNIYFDMIVSSFTYQRSGAAARAVGAVGVGDLGALVAAAANKSAGGSVPPTPTNAQASASPSAADLFTQVERHTIDALYNLANLNQDAGRKLMDLLHRTISQRIATYDPGLGSGLDPTALRLAGTDYLQHVVRMYELMSSLVALPDTPLFEDERTSVSLKLLNYLQSTGHVRKEMLSKYVQYLVDLHLGLKNYTEAGCTVMQAIRMLGWSDSLMPPLDSTLTKYPGEKERERKEKLYQAAIGYFKLGEDWERAIAYGEELRLYYQFDVFDFTKLAALLQEQADCFRAIVSTERFYSNYFRVVYFGSGFDEELTGADSPAGTREFVYRGVKLEPVMDFTNRIKRKWPEAKILMSSDRPSDELLAAHKQIISITTLTRATAQETTETFKALGIATPPSTTATAAGAAGGKAGAASLVALGGSSSHPAVLSSSFRPSQAPPKGVSTYREQNDLSVFVYAKGVQKDKKNPNEFRHLWVSKTAIVTADSFPSIRRRLECVARRETLLSPIENAIGTMKNKNAELREKVAHVASAPAGPVDVGPLSMNLNGMIDAAVNGGTQKYIEAFLSETYLADAQQEGGNAAEAVARAKEQQAELRASIVEQIAELKIGLDVFGKRCDEKLRGLYEHLRGFFDQMVAKAKAQGVVQDGQA